MSKKDYLIIDRSKWITGSNCLEQPLTGKGNPRLLNEEGFMCCLGFRCHQMGIPKKELFDKPMPSSLKNKYTIPDLLDDKGNNTLFASDAARINDNPDYSPKLREKLIKKHFATIGVTVEFTGRYKKG